VRAGCHCDYQVEGLGSIGQRDQQRMIAQVRCKRCRCLLTLGVGADESSVDVEDRFLEERGGLLGPDPHSRLIDGVHQSDDISFGEAAAEVPSVVGSGGAGSQSIEIDLVVASQLQVLDPLAAARM